MMTKPILCLDFDGVIHSYSSGWQGANVIADPPVLGALEFIERALEHFDVCIFSSRSSHPDGIEAMKTWMWKWSDLDDAWLEQVRYPTEKPAAFLTIDDRAIQFTGTWPVMDTLKAFKPWNKR
jgi:hypothetical protein